MNPIHTVRTKAIVISSVARTTNPWGSSLYKIVKIPIRPHPEIFWTVKALSFGSSFDKIIQVAIAPEAHSVSVPFLNTNRYLVFRRDKFIWRTHLLRNDSEVWRRLFLIVFLKLFQRYSEHKWYGDDEQSEAEAVHVSTVAPSKIVVQLCRLPWSLGPRKLLSVALAASLLSLRQCYNTLLHQSLPHTTQIKWNCSGNLTCGYAGSGRLRRKWMESKQAFIPSLGIKDINCGG